MPTPKADIGAHMVYNHTVTVHNLSESFSHRSALVNTTAVDVVIVGTGMGGSTAARALADTGASVLMLERGDFLPAEDENWSPDSNYAQHRYKNAEPWKTAKGRAFTPGVHYYVGGNTKVFGAALPRFRREDFQEIEHLGGTSPAWPISYDELEPYYGLAEQIYRVHAQEGDDPTDPTRSWDFPYPPVPHEPVIDRLADALRGQGLHPYRIPLGVDIRIDGTCLRCGTCDGYPCKVRAKSDAEVCAVLPALNAQNVKLWTNAYVERINVDSSGTTASSVTGERAGEPFTVRAGQVLVACGAGNSAALLLRSTSASHENGLGNARDTVGRNYMVHNNSVLVAVHPRKKNPTVFQKTLAVNDFYGPDNSSCRYPLGNLQLIGKIHEGTLKGARPLLSRRIRSYVADRSIEWWVMSEDIPDPDNRITLSTDGSIVVHWKPTNIEAHHGLLRAAKKMMRQAGYPLIFTETMGIETNSHQCGTLRMGEDVTASVVDPDGRVHGLTNVYVVDSSVFSSSSASNPALTIAALSLRTIDRIIASW